MDEIKILMNFLELVVNEYKNNSFKLFELLDFDENEQENEQDSLEVSFDTANQPKILKVESLSNTTTNQIIQSSKPIIRKPSAFVGTHEDSQDDDIDDEEEEDDDEGNGQSIKREVVSGEEDDDLDEDYEEVSQQNRAKKRKFKKIKNETYESFNQTGVNTTQDMSVDGNDDDDDDEGEEKYWKSTYDSKNRVRKFSDFIRNELEKHFQVNKYLTGDAKKELAIKLNLEPRQVQKWFVHRREKLRRQQRQLAQMTGQSIDETRNEGENIDENVSPNAEQPPKPQRAKVNVAKFKFSTKVLNFLEKIFQKSPYLTNEQYEKLGLRVNVSTDRLKTWFKHRRQASSEIG